MEEFIHQVNYWRILAVAGAYFLLGTIWFSAFFGDIWARELDNHGIVVHEPSKEKALVKLFLTFAANLIVTFAMAYLLHLLKVEDIKDAVEVGLITGIGFAAAPLCIGYNWEGRSLRLMAIDAGYPIVGLLMISVILTLWT